MPAREPNKGSITKIEGGVEWGPIGRLSCVLKVRVQRRDSHTACTTPFPALTCHLASGTHRSRGVGWRVAALRNAHGDPAM